MQDRKALAGPSRRELLTLIGMTAGSAAMYQAMTSLGFAAESGYKGPIRLDGDPKGASVLILGAGLAGMVAALEGGPGAHRRATERHEGERPYEPGLHARHPAAGRVVDHARLADEAENDENAEEDEPEPESAGVVHQLGLPQDEHTAGAAEADRRQVLELTRP